MKIILKIFIVLIIFAEIIFPQQKLAQTGFKFLNVGLGARATGMAEAFTSVEQNSLGMFYNPSSMARQNNFIDVSIGSTSWIADISHNNFSASISPNSGEWGVFGFAMQSVDYGLIEGTILANNYKGYLDESDLPGLNLKPTAMSFGFGYAKALSDKFQIGGNIKYVLQNLGESIVEKNADETYLKHNNKLNMAAYDFGLIYKTGYKSLNIGMSIRNFAKEVKFEKENFQIPLIFRIGASVNAIDFIEDVDKEMHSLLVSVDASHPRDFPEQVNIGTEYQFMNMISLRFGNMIYNKEFGSTFGIGVRKKIMDYELGVDYSSTDNEDFGSINRISIQFNF